MAEDDSIQNPKKDRWKELTSLLDTFKDSTGRIPKRLAYLTTSDGKKILEAVVELDLARAGTWEKTSTLLERSKSVILDALGEHKIRVRKKNHISWTPERIEIVKGGFTESKKMQDSKELEELKDKMLCEINALPGKKMEFSTVYLFASRQEFKGWGMPKEEREKLALTLEKKEQTEPPQKKEISQEEIFENLPLEIRNWNDPEILEIDPAVWALPGSPVALMSGIAYGGDEHRAGAVYLAYKKCQERGVRFIDFVALLIDKVAFQEKITKTLGEAKQNIVQQKLEAKKDGLKIPVISVRSLKSQIEKNIIQETAKALSAQIPKLKKPSENGKKEHEYVRLYIQVSPIYDGPYGERVALALQSLRPDDIRVERPNKRLEIKGVQKYLGGLAVRRPRMPSEFYSNAPEKEIRAEERRASRLADIWAVGPFASNVYTPDGIRKRPYVTIPGLRSLEQVHMAENQIGISFIEYESPDKLPLLESWSFRDLIENERQLITPPKGATDLQKKIVRCIQGIQEERAQTIGRMADNIQGHSREEIETAIKPLLEDGTLKLKKWPGLLYNEASQEYDFRLNWVQERLRYVLPTTFQEERMLFFGCTHFGYTTTDYEHMIKEYPKIILKKNIQHLFCLGDLIAGMKHDIPHSGELIAGTNYTDHEIFAAEGMATIIYNPFAVRLADALKARTSTEAVTTEELSSLIDTCLVSFNFIRGNHDGWVEINGNTPLVVFHRFLLDILLHHIGKFLYEHKLPYVDLRKILEKHIIHYQDIEATHTLPSGLKIGMLHPHEGGAKTTTLKLQEGLLGSEGCHIWAIANYHRATCLREWQSDLGELLGVMAGAAGPIYTYFERRKRKRFNDFGPIYVRVLTHKNRIIMHEIGYDNKPLLKKRLSKYTNPDELKKKLGLLTL